MKEYMDILVALELDLKQDQEFLCKVLDLTDNYKAHLHLAHVVDPIYNYGMSSSEVIESAQEHYDYCQKVVSELGTKFEIPKEYQYVIVGNIIDEVLDLIRMTDADILVLGNHARHGLKTLFNNNNTENLVRNAGCDILAVRAA